ncbi:MAG TPA: hypothetical protein GXZ60_11340 [Intrasporangiaceae bacterium]|nr:hypothetical protein [Intrasporangiaceae bacterium]
MELLIGIAVVAVIGLAVFGVFGVLVGGAVVAEDKGRAKATRGADETLDRLFATAEPTATYDSRPFNAIPQTTVIEGAIERDWELVNNERGLLIFKRSS